jgi:hypothetical protein
MTIDHLAPTNANFNISTASSHLSEPLRLVAMKRIAAFAEKQESHTWIGPSRLISDRRNS